MKKLFTMLFLFAGMYLANSAVVLRETFESGSLGTGWTIYSNVGANSRWKVAEGILNGSSKSITPYEWTSGTHYLAGVPSVTAGNYNEWLVSPEVTIPTSQQDNIISFETYYTDMGNDMTLRWFESDTSKAIILWRASKPNKYDSPVEVNISSLNGKKGHFAWVMRREAVSAIDGSAWGIDMICVETVINGVDLEPTLFLSPLAHEDINMYKKGTDIPVSVKVINNGQTDAKGYTISYTFEGNTVTESLPDIAAKEEITYTFKKAINVSKASASNTITVSTQSANDEVSSNNSLSINSFWTSENSCLTFDFESDGYLVSGDWGASGWVVYQGDKSSTYRISSLQTIFDAAGNCWAVGTAGGTLATAIWGHLVAFTCSDFSETSIACDRWMILPKVRIGSNPTFLSWDAATANTVAGKATEDYEILVSTKTNAISDFTKVHGVVKEKLVNANDVKDKPSTRYIDLSSYSGKDIYIAFRDVTSGNDRGMLLVDNIKFLGTGSIGTDVKEMESIQTKVYPNPANDFVRIESENNILSVTVYNALGQKVSFVSVNDNVYSMNTQALKNGLYIIRVETEVGTAVEKVNVVR